MGLLPPTGAGRASETALGDWYVNRVVVDRQPLLLLVSALSLLAAVLPARDVRGLPERLCDVVGERLKRLGVRRILIEAEVRAMPPVTVAPTADRSVVGIMVDFAKMIPGYLPSLSWDESALSFVESRLGENPCHAARSFNQVIFPEQKATELLEARWNAG